MGEIKQEIDNNRKEAEKFIGQWAEDFVRDRINKQETWVQQGAISFYNAVGIVEETIKKMKRRIKELGYRKVKEITQLNGGYVTFEEGGERKYGLLPEGSKIYIEDNNG